MTLNQLNQQILACTRCPRLREYCLKVAQEKRAAYRQETYFGKPVPNFGDAAARLLIVGLAPAAHGANRTGRMFTGDRSGEFLYRAMHATGFASQPTARHAGDGLKLRDALITATCHCAPPDNRPTPAEIAACAPFLDATFVAAPRIRVVLALGKIGFDAVLRYYQRRDWVERLSPYRFGHGAEYAFPSAGGKPVPTLLCSYHPSQQNTFTRKLTAAMLEAVFRRAQEIVAA